MTLDGAPGTATLAWHLGATRRLDLNLRIGQLDLDAWARAAGAWRGASPLPITLVLAAQSATLAGTSLQRLNGTATLEPTRWPLR